MSLDICLYHPKNHLNLHDAASIAASLGSRLYVVARPGVDYKLDALPSRLRSVILFASDLAEVSRRAGPLVVVETYGSRLVSEIHAPQHGVLVLGAEDYGVPPEALAGAEVVAMARLPVAVEGMSYNVVSALVMTLYELLVYGARSPVNQNEDVFIYTGAGSGLDERGGRG